jgi:hypothetical protein
MGIHKMKKEETAIEKISGLAVKIYRTGVKDGVKRFRNALSVAFNSPEVVKYFDINMFNEISEKLLNHVLAEEEDDE